MEKYALIQIGHSQYIVEEGKKYTVPRFITSEDKVLSLSEVLMVSAEGKKAFGSPFVDGAKVNATVISEGLGEKVKTLKFKAKSRYRKRSGFRKKTVTFLVDSIVTI